MRADRLLSMVMLLQARGKLTATALAEELGVSRRTILRDVEALSFTGIPIYTEGGHGGGIALDENYRVTLTGLSEEEIHTLFISSDDQLLKDLGMDDAAKKTIHKLFAALPTLHRPLVNQIRQRILIDPLWWWHDTQPKVFLGELQQAVFEDRCIEAVYEHYDGTIVNRMLEPYSLVAKSSRWYLIGKRDGELRIYLVSRFHSVTLLDQYFHRPDDFDLLTYWQEHSLKFAQSLAQYRFTLRVLASRLNFVSWVSAGRFQIVEPEDADGWLTINFEMETIELAKMIVFGLGSDAIVLDPPELWQSITETARELLERP
jgi:predicted DNA-binding transcriptional regulator YafY